MKSKKCKYCKKLFYKEDFKYDFNRMITCGSPECRKKYKEEWTYSKHCPDCGKSITHHANKCKPCTSKGKNNPFYGKTHTRETLKKINLFYEGMTSPKKGKTYEGMYGIEKAQELKRKIRLSKKGKKQSRETIRKRLRRRTPSSLELKMIKIIEKYDLPYKFVGNGNFFIERKNPDFINTNGKKIAIEVFYRGFKTKKCFQGQDLSIWKKERQKVFSKYGWTIEFFDETQVNDVEILRRKL